MAPRRAAEAVSEEPEEELVSLTFNEPLSWRAGKPIATGELLRRLDTLSNELQEMDQLAIEKDSFTKVAKELAGQNLLGHKDKGVRAFVACCLVDILKLCAPDAPLTPTQLKVWHPECWRMYLTPPRMSLRYSLPRSSQHFPIHHTPTMRSTSMFWSHLWKSRVLSCSAIFRIPIP